MTLLTSPVVANGSADGRAVSDKLAVANVGVSLGAVRLLGFDPFATAGQLKPREKG
jgi:cystathionine beta-lyase/cystathionine gamma-synthase